MTASLMPEARQRYNTNIGLPLAFGKVYTYAAGTSTPKATYQDAAGTVPHSNPIVLDAKGEALIFWSGAYKVDVKTALGGTVTGYPVDDYISSITPADLSATSGAGLVGFLDSATYAVGTVGRWLKDLATSAGASLIGFIQAGVGAILRTMQAKARESVTFEDFDAVGDGVADDILAIEKAMAAHAGRIKMLNKVYAISRPVKLPANCVIEGEGPGSPNPVTGAARISVLKPLAGFVGSAVMLMDPANDGTDVYAYGNGLSNLTIDMYNVRAAGLTAIELNSVTNAETFANVRVLNQDSGSCIKTGVSANAGALQTDGVVFDNFYSCSNAIDPANTDPGVVMQRSNEITFRDSKVTRRSNGIPIAGTVGVHIFSDAAGTVNDIRLNGLAVGGYETGVLVESKALAGQGPRWVRAFGCAFESVKFCFRFVGIAAAPTQFHTIESVRQQSTVNGGALVWLDDYACNSRITVEEFQGVSINGGTANLVLCAAQSQGNLINALLSGVINNGIDNVVIGRRGDASEMSKLYREATIAPALLNGWTNGSVIRTSAGYWKDAQGVVHLQGGYLTGGAFGGGAGNALFVLPAGYRPVNGASFAPGTDVGTAGSVLIQQDGTILPLAGLNFISLDGITFATT